MFSILRTLGESIHKPLGGFRIESSSWILIGRRYSLYTLRNGHWSVFACSFGHTEIISMNDLF